MKRPSPFSLLLVITGAAAFSSVAPLTRSRQSSSRCYARAPRASELIKAADNFMTSGTGYYSPIDVNALSDDFVFRGPVIGPLGKDDYVDVLEYFSVYKAIPDIEPNCWGFSVDPQDPYRVWFFLRATGTYQQPLGGFLGNIASPPPDSREYHGSPEAWSLTFDEERKVQYISAGYVVDLFDQKATTGGKGLTFGILATLGLLLPSGSGSPILQAIQYFSNAFPSVFPKAFSDPSKVPSWWKSDKFGADI